MGFCCCERREGKGEVYGACLLGLECPEWRLAVWDVAGSALRRGGEADVTAFVKCVEGGIGDRCSL